jgi:hypothetical protein
MTWGALNVKFGIYVYQMTIFRGGIKQLFKLFFIILLLYNFKYVYIKATLS